MMVDMEGVEVMFRGSDSDPPSDAEEHDTGHDQINNETSNGIVSSLFHCQSASAAKLCIYDLSYKLRQGTHYDIGGSYTGTEPDLWFHYTTSICPGYNYLLNLYVCHRKAGNFSVSVSSSNELSHRKVPRSITGLTVLSDTLTTFTFRSMKPEENYFVKTFCFTEKDLTDMENNTLAIPLRINMNPTQTLNSDVIKRIKLQHDLGDLLSKQEQTDFVLESAEGKKFPVHKIILAAHSPVLRNLVKESKTSSLFIEISNNEMDLLLQFIYTGTIKDILKQNCETLLAIVDRFQLKNLLLLTQYTIGAQINVDNAIEIALIAKKYQLDKLLTKVFKFINANPAVMETEGWKNLNDVELTKRLFQYNTWLQSGQS